MIPTWEVVLRNNEKKRRGEDDTNIEAGRERERERERERGEVLCTRAKVVIAS